MLIPPYHPTLVRLLQRDATRHFPPLPHSFEDWDRLLAAADDEGLTPRLLHSLRVRDASGEIPSAIWDRLQRSVRTTAVRSLLFAEELRAILQALAAAEIAVLPLRGLALLQEIPGLDPIRPMGDIDLLVKRQELDAVALTLERLGYRAMDRRRGFAASFSYTLEYVKEQHGWMIVEPHWTLSYPPASARFDMTETWRRVEPMTFLGVPTLRLARSDLFLHLCLHLAHKGADARLLWWYELDRLIRFNLRAEDWSGCMESAAASGQIRLLSGVLSTLHRLLGTPMPGGRELEPAHLCPMSLGERLLAESDLDGRESLVQFFSVRGAAAKVRFAWGIAVPTKDFMRLHYSAPSALLALVYFARIWSLLRLTLIMLVRALFPHMTQTLRP